MTRGDTAALGFFAFVPRGTVSDFLIVCVLVGLAVARPPRLSIAPQVVLVWEEPPVVCAAANFDETPTLAFPALAAALASAGASTACAKWALQS